MEPPLTTEEGWLASDNPVSLLRHLQRAGLLRTKRGRRKLWLFIAACFRGSWPLLSDTGRAAVELLEGHADNPDAQTEFGASRDAMFAEYRSAGAAGPSAEAQMRDWLTFALWQMTISRTTRQAFDTLCQWDTQFIRELKAWPRFAELAREMFGNPYRPEPDAEPGAAADGPRL